ncbi:TEL1 [Acrasis kona]|uniref:TEL1 n=1 Tax=Acrasis kona TaxID=1008807 RepID=A0AAW2YI95_9EUKA
MEHHPDFVLDSYKRIASNEDSLTILEMFSRAINPESPRWYCMPFKNESHESRMETWKITRDEMYSQLKEKSQTSNMNAYHNCAVLNFLLGERDTCFKFMDLLIEKDEHLEYVKSLCYFYLCTNQIEEASSILLHLLDQDPIDFYSMYLCCRLLSKLFDTNDEANSSIKTFRDQLISLICTYKPKNGLYKLYEEHYRKGNGYRDFDITPDEARIQCMTYVNTLVHNKKFTRDVVKKPTLFDSILNFFSFYLPHIKMLLNLFAVFATVAGFASATRTLSFSKKKKNSPMLTSIQNSFFERNQDVQNFLNVETRPYNVNTIESSRDNIKVITRPLVKDWRNVNKK